MIRNQLAESASSNRDSDSKTPSSTNQLAESASWRRIVVDTHGGGLGDIVHMAWIADGARKAGFDFRFTVHPGHVSDRILHMLGQKFTTQKGPELHQTDGGFTRWNLTLPIIGHVEPRPVLWQRRFAELVGVDLKVEPVRPVATISETAMEWALGQKRASTGGDRPFVICFPFAAWSMREWPMHKFSRLLYALERDGYSTVAVHPTYTAVGLGRGNGTNSGNLGAFPRWLVNTDTDRLFALCKVADIVIGNGSGGPVLSGTLGTRTYAITGPDHPVVSFGHSPETTCIHVPKERLSCVGCRYDTGVGFGGICDFGCDALESLSWQEVHKAITNK